MPRKFLIPLLAAAFLAAPAMLSNTLVADMSPRFTTLSLSGSALAEDKLFNGTRSNTTRMGGGGGQTGNSNGQPGMAIKNSGVPKNTTKVNKTQSRSNTQHN